MRKAIHALWLRILGMRPRTAEQLRVWAVEQAIAGGARSDRGYSGEVARRADELVCYVVTGRF